MRESDRPRSERVSLLDRPPIAADLLPESEQPRGDTGVDPGSLRLAITNGEHRLYVGTAGSDALTIVYRSARGGGVLTSMRWVLSQIGAIVLGVSSSHGASVTCDIVSDDVNAVEVDGIERPVLHNAFLVPGSRGTPSCRVLTDDGWRDVPPPPPLE